jgi:hypothetical protein
MSVAPLFGLAPKLAFKKRSSAKHSNLFRPTVGDDEKRLMTLTRGLAPPFVILEDIFKFFKGIWKITCRTKKEDCKYLVPNLT